MASTIVDLTYAVPRVLRSGAISIEELRAVCGTVIGELRKGRTKPKKDETAEADGETAAETAAAEAPDDADNDGGTDGSGEAEDTARTSSSGTESDTSGSDKN